MELTKLITLTVVAKTLHFSRAAEEMGVTQPAVSHHIRTLERQIGQPLFSRANKDINLTEAGRLVLDYANEVLPRVEALRKAVARKGESQCNVLRLQGITRSLNSPFPELLRYWREKHDEIALMFCAANDYESVINSVKQGQIEFGFVPFRYDRDDLACVPWGRKEVSLLVSHEHVLAKHKGLSIAELEESIWIHFDKGFWARHTFELICDDFGIRPERTYETDDGSVVHGLIKSGDGVGILPRWGNIRDELKSGELVSIEPADMDLSSMSWIVFDNKNCSENMNKLLEFIFKNPLEGYTHFSN